MASQSDVVSRGATSSWSPDSGEAKGPLQGLRVIDVGTMFAGPLIATSFADLGADVVKVEHPRGDDVRRLGLSKDAVPLWWKVAGRNKRLLALDISRKEGADVLLRLIEDADVLVENFRPGRMAAWGLDFDTLHRRNPRLVVAHVSGFGQTGPYRERPGFGTLAEAFAGFAYSNGEPDGPPILPSIPLADSVSAMVGAYAVMAAVWDRDTRSGAGQEIDLSLYESLLSLMGSQIVDYDQLGVVAQRRGNRSPRSVPRNAYATADGRWIVVSSSNDGMALRLFRAIGRPDMAADPSLATNPQRVARLEEIDSIVADWMAASTQADALAVLERHEVAAVPVNDIAQLLDDHHVRERQTIAEMADPDFGTLRLQNVVPRFSATPGKHRWPGKTGVGADSGPILSELGYSDNEISKLVEQGVIAAGGAD